MAFKADFHLGSVGPKFGDFFRIQTQKLAKNKLGGAQLGRWPEVCFGLDFPNCISVNRNVQSVLHTTIVRQTGDVPFLRRPILIE